MLVDHKLRRVGGFSLLETLVGMVLFTLVSTASLGVWTMYSRQAEKAQKHMLANALCQLTLEASIAVGYDGVLSQPRDVVVIDSSWTDITTGVTKPIQPSASFEFEITVKQTQPKIKSVSVDVYYQGKRGERNVNLKTLMYRSN